MEIGTLLELFDRQMRREVASADPAARVERDPRFTIYHEPGWSGVLWSDLDESNADEAIARAAARLAELGGEAEWKVYAHDRPADLAERLVAAGFAPGEQEAVLVADLATLPETPAPEGVELRVATDADAISAFVEVNETVFGEDYSWLGKALVRALDGDPPSALAVVAFAGGSPVAGARIEFPVGSAFASLWGGSTVPEWRGRGLYRATVSLRARLARERGYRYLQVDALPTSRPILERLGFVQITTTTPFA